MKIEISKSSLRSSESLTITNGVYICKTDEELSAILVWNIY